MPPKRKASSTALKDAPPPTKRTLRKTPSVAPKPSKQPTRRSTRARPATTSDERDSEDGVKEEVPTALPSRNRRSTAKPNITATRVAEASSSRVQLPDPITTTRRGNNAHIIEEPDELLLIPSKSRPARYATPPRPTTPHIGTPRAFLQCVEIVTPSRRLPAGSPAPRVTGSRSGNNVLFQDSTRASTPSPTKHALRNNTSPSRARPTQIVHGSPSPHEEISRKNLPSGSNASPVSPTKRQQSFGTPPSSPSKRGHITDAQLSPSRQPHSLSAHVQSSLRAQQRAILRALRDVPDIEEEHDLEKEEDRSTNAIAYEQLSDLLRGTVVRGEGNSCLLIGPRASGKTRLVEQAISALPEKPIIIRLSGHAQQNDRVAIREIARQLTQQTGSSFLPAEEDKPSDNGFMDPENPFLDIADATHSIALPAPAHLLALISMIPTLPRATVVVIDAFDQFATHARQSLLYCLFDTVQSCRVGQGNKALAVIGVTTRVDTINLLEKRVKSRFSGRMLRTACPGQLQYWTSLARSILTTPIDGCADDEWPTLWATAVDEFLRQDAVIDALKESFALTRDIHTVRRILTPTVLDLVPASPFLSASKFAASVSVQRCPPRFSFLSTLPYPAICLLIAAVHAQTSGHDAFTFEMLHEAFRDQVRTSQSAPVQVEGGSIGMVRCSREVLMGAFERLVSMRVFVAIAPPSSSTTREFLLHRCVVDRIEIKKAVVTMGQTNLKKWLNKMQ